MEDNDKYINADGEGGKKITFSVFKKLLIIFGGFFGFILIGYLIFVFNQDFFKKLNETTITPPSVSGTDEYTNTIGVAMIRIPAGSFFMGSCDISQVMEEENKGRALSDQPAITANCYKPDDDALDDETPLHKVEVPAFHLGKTEVTLGHFKKYIAAAGRRDLMNDDFMKYNSNGDNAPVVQVSWNDAQDFIAWLNKTDGGGYRLLSEAEWEYACGAGGVYTYCGSNDIGSVAWYEVNSDNRPRAVASKQANNFGLHDMSGNVSEWTQDCWNKGYNGAPSNGAAWVTGDCRYRVLRGGSWVSSALVMRASYRDNQTADSRHNDVGFRLARTH